MHANDAGSKAGGKELNDMEDSPTRRSRIREGLTAAQAIGEARLSSLPHVSSSRGVAMTVHAPLAPTLTGQRMQGPLHGLRHFSTRRRTPVNTSHFPFFMYDSMRRCRLSHTLTSRAVPGHVAVFSSVGVSFFS